MNKDQLYALIHADADIRVTNEPCDVPVRGNAMASGDDDFDRKTENNILRRVNLGHTWAWCDVTVTVEYGGFSGQDTMGCCSYQNKQDFLNVEKNGYLPDMIQQAIDELINNVYNARMEALNVLTKIDGNQLLHAMLLQKLNEKAESES